MTKEKTKKVPPGKEQLVTNVLSLQTDLKALLTRVDAAQKEHQSLLTEDQILQKYVHNSLGSTVDFGAVKQS